MTTADLERARRLYDRVAMETAAIVIRRYSTSFGLASRLLSAPIRRHVDNIYALVRLADEVVDGVAASAELGPDEIARLLDTLENETLQAMRVGYSTNFVVHAFALTARQVSFGPELVVPFYASMRADLTATEHTPESFTEYVYGSAEVVGLMCLAAFLGGHTIPDDRRSALVDGARHLGAAFQKINFLRDLAADFAGLGRSYFPGVNVETFGEEAKRGILLDIDNDLRIARASLPLLPSTSRRAVALAQGLFGELTRRLWETPAAVLAETRIRVPNPVKLRIAASASAGRLPREYSATASATATASAFASATRGTGPATSPPPSTTTATAEENR
ncbi:phytoene/squalene synthase family protein [Subtercola boreus]|uniref:Phytoene synthase n=1 Tax=Subtercola boreus TaxID=120213 RepID=A0A3E0W885_9MICO|nr:squalene/phytoene synthase family protein [Subtercola boreus]RFA18038.1 phytoene synthase [Subtercola boreus]RFA18420.1 phytoene synthase [Subtercola boreus]RFA24949.1 phytoene synthase [Subtercola boreus]